jgi:hypothetical protein
MCSWPTCCARSKAIRQKHPTELELSLASRRSGLPSPFTSARAAERGAKTGSRGYEASGSQDELRSCFAVIFHVHVVQAGYHLALPVTDARHMNRETVASDPKLLASAKVGRNLRTVDDVLAGQALAGPANVFASTTATRLPSPANVHAATVEPVPPPRITRSNSSSCVILTR